MIFCWIVRIRITDIHYYSNLNAIQTFVHKYVTRSFAKRVLKHGEDNQIIMAHRQKLKYWMTKFLVSEVGPSPIYPRVELLLNDAQSNRETTWSTNSCRSMTYSIGSYSNSLYEQTTDNVVPPQMKYKSHHLQYISSTQIIRPPPAPSPNLKLVRSAPGEKNGWSTNPCHFSLFHSQT